MMKPLSEKRIDTLNGYKYSEEEYQEAVLNAVEEGVLG